MELRGSDKKNIWHPFTPLADENEPFSLNLETGFIFKLRTGEKLSMPFLVVVNIHGHSNPVIAKAIAEQAKKLEHVIFGRVHP